jgi:enoyl-CoA hydratase/carnithine racemase
VPAARRLRMGVSLLSGAFGTVRLTSLHDGHIARLDLDTGTPHNVITSAALDDIRAALDHVIANPPRVLIIAGRRENFSRGAAVDEISGLGADFRRYIDREFALFSAVEALPFVTIAALTGTTIGNAAELTLACDFRIATEAARFSLPEVAIGFVAPAQRLCRYVGLGVAKDILLGARLLGAEEALRLGLFSRVVPEAEFEAKLLEFAVEFAGKPPIAIRVTKEGIAHAYGFAGADYDMERKAAWDTYQSDDVKEGFASLRERRRPVFQGR